MFNDDLQLARIDGLAERLSEQAIFVEKEKIKAVIMAACGYFTVDKSMREKAIENFRQAITILENL